MTTLPLYAQIKQIFLGTEFSSLEGEFLTGKIFEAIEKLDKNFIAILLNNKTTKEHFFELIENAYILNQNKLYEFFNAKEYFDNSFTSYTNKIGLIKKDSFIKKFDDVVLAFPYKDCILEGGMSNEDVAKKEVFYNSIISKEEIDRLFEPKVLTNIKKFDKEGQSNPTEISMDDNLILKGNNLLALHSLKQRYAGQIKLIYIDPPYNTGNDGFKYNDRFNHSTWLTFMKNRLEVARELLRDDGVIFVSIDDNEQAYLKVLMDEVFGRENFVSCIAYRKTDNQANIGTIARVKEYILLFSKTKNISLNKVPLTEKALKEYRYSDENGKFRRAILLDKTRGTHKYIVTTPIGTTLNGPWMVNEKNFKELEKTNGVYWTTGGDEQPYGKIYLEKSKGQIPNDWIDKEYGTNQQATISLEKLVGYRAFDFSKSVPLIQHFIRIGSNQNDIILDFHAGSGTTAHAVLDRNKEDGGNRKFILVEQMDYIETITAERVKKVIEKNQEGSFIYAELKTIDTFNEEDIIGRLNDNMRYLPIGEIDDESYAINEAEKILNKQFYGVQ